MDGYTVSEAASVLGVSTERVWELLARGVLAGEPEGPSGMRVFLQPRPGSTAPPAPAADGGARPQRGPNGHDGELSPFRELLTEFRSLTERYGQALLALGEARGEVASLRGRVELLEARIDLRLPPVQVPPSRRAAWEMTTPEEEAEPQPATVEPVEPTAARGEAVEPMAEPEAVVAPPAEPEPKRATAVSRPAKRERGSQRAAKRRSRPRAPRRAGLAEALARAEDPTLAGLPGGREAAEALAALQQTQAAEAVHAEQAPPAESPEVEAPVEEQPSVPEPPAATAEASIEVDVEPWEPAPASELLVAEEPLAAVGEPAAAAEAIEPEEEEVVAEAIEVMPEPVEFAPSEPAEPAMPPRTEPQAPSEAVEETSAAPIEVEPPAAEETVAEEVVVEETAAEEVVVEEAAVEEAAVEEAGVEEPPEVWDQSEPLPADSPYTAQLAEPDWFSDDDLAAAGDQGYPVTGVSTGAEASPPTWDGQEAAAAPAEWEPPPGETEAEQQWIPEAPAPDFAAEPWTPMTDQVEAAAEPDEAPLEAPYEEGQSAVAGGAVDAITPADELPDQGAATFDAGEQVGPDLEQADETAPAFDPLPTVESEPVVEPSPAFEATPAFEPPPTIEATQAFEPPPAGEPTAAFEPQPADKEPSAESSSIHDAWAYAEEPFQPEAATEPTLIELTLTEPAATEPILAEPEAFHESEADNEPDAFFSEPALGEPTVTEPAVSEPEIREPELERLGAAEPQPTRSVADVAPPAQPSVSAAPQEAYPEAEEEQVMWLGDAEETATYAEEMEVASGAWHEPWAPAGPEPAPAPTPDEATRPDPAALPEEDLASGGAHWPPSTPSSAVPDDIYVEGWRDDSPPAEGAGHEGPRADAGATGPPSPASGGTPSRASTGSRELDEGLAALDALARMAAAKRTARSQPFTQQEPPLTGDEIVQRLRSQYAAQRQAGQGRPAPTSSPPSSSSATTPPTPPASSADVSSDVLRDQRSPAARAYRRLRRIFPG